jgi:ketosteroid isomerase-like protein
MGPAENKQLVQDFLAATNAGDRDRLAELVAEDMAWWIPQSGSARVGIPTPMIGRDQFIAMQQDALDMLYVRESQKITVHRLIAEDDFVAAYMSMEMRTKAGAPYENQYLLMFRFADGRIAEHWEFTDTAYAFEQFDAAPEGA